MSRTDYIDDDQGTKADKYDNWLTEQELDPIQQRMREAIRSSIKAGAPGLSDLTIGAIMRSIMLKLAYITTEG